MIPKASDSRESSYIAFLNIIHKSISSAVYFGHTHADIKMPEQEFFDRALPELTKLGYKVEVISTADGKEIVICW